LHARRQVIAYLHDPHDPEQVFTTLGPRYAGAAGCYRAS